MQRINDYIIIDVEVLLNLKYYLVNIISKS